MPAAGTIRWGGPKPTLEPVLRPLNNVEREAIANPNALELDEGGGIRNAVVMLHGVDPYVGAVDHKPVGADLLYAAVYAVSGPNP